MGAAILQVQYYQPQIPSTNITFVCTRYAQLMCLLTLLFFAVCCIDKARSEFVYGLLFATC